MVGVVVFDGDGNVNMDTVWNIGPLPSDSTMLRGNRTFGIGPLPLSDSTMFGNGAIAMARAGR